MVAAFAVEPALRVAPGPAAARTDLVRATTIARGNARPRDDARIDPNGAAQPAVAASAPEDDVLVVGAPTIEPAPSPTPEPTPVPTPVPTARPTPAPIRTAAPAPVVSITTAAAEQRMLDLMNTTRIAGGLVPLALDAGVSAAARLHSQVESEYGYVYHDGPDGTARSRNVPACGTGWYGENTGKIWRGNVDALHIEFMAEPWEPINHRTNIMDPAFRRVGIGAVQGRDALYMTMVFCR